MHTAFVLAAGFGTRLRPLTDHVPKPLVPVCGVPLLAYSLALCARHGLTDVVVNAHWLAEQLAPWAGAHEGVRVTISHETPEILGTGGGLRRVRGALAPRFAVVNADVLTDVDLTALLAAVRPGSGAFALRPAPDAATRYGTVAADVTGTVVVMRDIARAEPHGEVATDTHFTGIHALERDALDLVPEGFACVVRTAYKQLVPQRRVAAIRHEGLWLDVGDPAAYLDANLAALHGDLTLPVDPFPRAAWSRRGARARGTLAAVGDAEVLGDAWIGPGARIGRARLRDVVIGAGAVVPDGVELDGAVVWEGCGVPPGRHRRAVVFPGGVLHVDAPR